LTFPKKLLLFKNMFGAILFYFCYSYLITLIVASRGYQGVDFCTRPLEIAKTKYLFLVVIFFTPK